MSDIFGYRVFETPLGWFWLDLDTNHGEGPFLTEEIADMDYDVWIRNR